MDAIFKALSDETRRTIVEVLAVRDGQTLGELEESIAETGVEMSRFGIMKHLKVMWCLSKRSLIVGLNLWHVNRWLKQL